MKFNRKYHFCLLAAFIPPPLVLKMTNLTTEDILASLDLNKVASEILTDPDSNSDILGFEYEEVKRMVIAGAEKWLIPDLTYIQPETVIVESPFFIDLGGQLTRGIIDLGGTLRNNHYDQRFRGQKVVCDWKSSLGELDKTWETRLLNSHQWPLYATVQDAGIVSYRGISRATYTDGRNKTRDFTIFTWPAAIDGAKRHFAQVGGIVKALAATGADLWPMHKPSSCGMFNTRCPFDEDCTIGKAPRYSINPEEVVMSYSSAERFLTCPEKYRRTAKSERGLDGSDSTRTGGAMHRGLAEIWRQAFAIYGGKL